MNNIVEIQNKLKSNMDMLGAKYAIKKLALFGSYVRGEHTAGSDIDILAEFEKPPGLEFVDLAEDLEKLLNIKVDLVSKNAISSRLMRYIEKDLVYV